MVCVKRQVILSKLGAWRSWERVEGQGKGREGSEEKYVAQSKQNKTKDPTRQNNALGKE